MLSAGNQAEALARSAATFLQRGLAARSEPTDADLFVVYVATALEHLAKSVLVGVHPALISHQAFDDLLHSVGRSDLAKTPRAAQRTISASDAITRCAQVVPDLQPLVAITKTVFAARNGLVHLAVPAEDADEKAIGDLLRVVAVLVDHCPLTLDECVGPYAQWVHVVLSGRATAIERDVQDLIAAAVERFRKRESALTDEERATLKVAVDKAVHQPGTDQYEYLAAECPACSSTITIEGGFDVDWEVEWDYADGESYAAGSYPRLFFTPGYLYCPTCHLELDGEERLTAAGFDRMERQDFDPQPLYEDLYAEYHDY